MRLSARSIAMFICSWPGRLALIGLAAGLVVILFVKRPTPRAAQAVDRPRVVTGNLRSFEPDDGPVRVDIPVRDRIYRDFFVGDNPITPPKGEAVRVYGEGQDGPVLKAIFIGSKRRAWINDVLVSEGQRFGLKRNANTDDLWEVTRIETDKVYLQRGTEVMVLAMATEEGPQMGR